MVSMSVYPELDGLSLSELTLRFYAPSLDENRYATAYLTEAAARIGEHGNDGVRFLREQVDRVEDDEPRLRAVMLGLAIPRVNDPWVQRFLLAHLSDRRPAVVMEAIDALTTLHVLATHDQVLALAGHRSPYVRGAVLRYLGALFPTEAKPLLLRGLKDRHFVVRESAIDSLDDIEAVDTVDVIRPLLNDPHPHVREAAEWAVRHLSADTVR
jgi:HEAT repeat protein